MWYHHYLQHPGHTHIKETMKAVIYWKGMRNTIQSKTKSCKTCQVNKTYKQKYGHVPPKIVISTPWEALCINLVGPYTLKGKDGLSIDLMALTMIDPASSLFKVVELPTIMWLMTKKVNGKERTIKEEIFDKSSDWISQLVNKIWLCRYLWCCYLIYNNRSEFKLHFETLCNSYGIKRKPTTINNPHLWARPSGPRNHDAHLWTWHGWFSWTCWHWHIHWQCSMGNLLNIPHSIKSPTRCCYIWTRHAIQHSVHSWLETNWRL